MIPKVKDVNYYMKDLKAFNDHIENDVLCTKSIPTNPRFVDLSGNRYGKLTVLHYGGKGYNGVHYYWCHCDCGNELYVRMPSLISGNTISCGCAHKEMLQERLTTHNSTNTRLYRIYRAMLTRCYNPNFMHHDLYYDKGIKLCDEWLGEHGFENFKEWAYNEADPGYSDYYEEHKEVWISIDRIDSDKNYEPSNCRFANGKVQGNNTSRNSYKRYQNYVFTLKQWSEILNIPYSELQYRNNRYWTDYELLTTPYNPDDAGYTRIPNPNPYMIIDIPLDYLKYNKYKEFCSKGKIDPKYSIHKSVDPKYDKTSSGTYIIRGKEYNNLK